MNMSKPRENKNSAGNPRNKRAQKNAATNETFRAIKKANHGLGQREVRRNLLRSSGQLPYTVREMSLDLEPNAFGETVHVVES